MTVSPSEQLTTFLSTLLSLPSASLPPLLLPTSPTSLVIHSLLLSPSLDPATRRLLSRVFTHLSKTPQTLSLGLLKAYANAFGEKNAGLVRKTVERALEEDEELLIKIEEEGPALLVSELERLITRVQEGETITSEELLHSISLARSTPLLSSIYGQHTPLFSTLSTLYSLLSPSTTLSSLRTKLTVLEFSHLLLEHSLLIPLSSPTLSSADRAALSEELDGALEPLLETTQSKGRGRALVEKSLIGDLDWYYRLGEELSKLGEKELANEVGRLSVGDEEEEDGLEVLKKMLKGESVDLTMSNGNGKGKGKAKEVPPETINEDHLHLSSILDLFPSLSPKFILAALAHPTFDHSSEKLIEALLEERALPVELERLRIGEEEEEVMVEEKKEKVERRNVFSSEKLDTSRFLLPGQTRQSTLPKLNLSNELKELIMARAEAPDSDEDEEEEEDWHEEDGVVRTKKVIGREEESDSDSEEQPGVPTSTETPPSSSSNPITPTIQRLLELTYIATSGSLFLPTSEVRRSTARKELREKTGLDDGILEGWKIMLDRDPNKEKILRKHEREFEGNSNRDREVVQGKREGGGGERGGRGRGAGGGGERGRGRGNSGRGDGGRRQRGADRKKKVG